MTKKVFFTICVVAATLSCSKQEGAISSPAEIILGVGEGFKASVETKATEISTVPSTLYWGASTGSAGSETVKWDAVEAAVSSGNIATGKYQSVTPVTYNYYVSNSAFSIASAKTTLTVADNSVDILSARVASNEVSPSVLLGHIFARTGSFTLTPQSGYVFSGTPTWKIVGKGAINGTAGTFNMTSNSWESASKKLSSQTDVASTSDLYLIPGEYTVYVTYTLTKGGAGEYSQTFTKHADITLQQGKVNNISGIANGANASEISLQLSVAPWGTANLTLPELQ